MLIGNGLSNLAGLMVVDTISFRSIFPPPQAVQEVAARLDWTFVPISFLLMGIAIIRYERPIRRCLDGFGRDVDPDNVTVAAARKRLLNEPFILIGLDLIVWGLAAVVYPLAFAPVNPGVPMMVRVVVQTLLVGVVTAIIAFFVLEKLLQKRLAPLFFPDGQLGQVAGAVRIRISTRIAALVVAVNLIPTAAYLAMGSGIGRSNADPEQLIALIQSSLMTNALIFAGVGLLLYRLVSINLTSPFGEIIRTLKRIRRGDLDARVKVVTNDEIGYTGDAINRMALGLKEREELRHSLELAREVQMNLLPDRPPRIDGLDIAGSSSYCDQTGGDYFDFLHYGNRIGVVTGDVSGHGVSSALLMTTARAFLRSRSAMPGSLLDVVSDVNRLLVEDIDASGQFMTLFYLMIDMPSLALSWIRAGHDPALLYRPDTDAFIELGGAGMALGITENWHGEMQSAGTLSRGEMLLLGTDGIWEAFDGRGDMFGKARFKTVVRQHRHRSASGIVDAVIESVNRFQGEAGSSDDITLVVVKALP